MSAMNDEHELIAEWLSLRFPPAHPVFKFETVGDQVAGVIEHLGLKDDLDFKTGDVRMSESGKPMKVLRVDLAREDGPVTLYLGGSGRRGSASQRDALSAACRAAGVRAPSLGDRFAMRRVTDRPSETKGFAPAHQFEARLTKGASA